MTTAQVMTILSGYYGDSYDGVFGEIVKAYLDTLGPNVKAALFKVVLKRYSRRWGKAPDVAIFEEHLCEAIDALPSVPLLGQDDGIDDTEREEMIRKLGEFYSRIGGKWDATVA